MTSKGSRRTIDTASQLVAKASLEMLSAEQLRLAAASDHGALQAAQTLSRKQQSVALIASTRPVLVQNLCDAITQTGKRHKEALLSSSIVQRFFSELPLRLLVILLGGLLPLLRSTATPGTPLLQAFGKTAGRKFGPALIMHTMASINPREHSLWCSAPSAEVCGLHHFQLTFYPPITSLAHFHSARKPPQHSRPDGNTRFPSGTLLLLEVSFAASHDQVPELRMRSTAQGQAHIQAIRRRHGFTIATEPIELPTGSWPLANSVDTSIPCVRTLDPDSSRAKMLLNQSQWTYVADTCDLAATAPDLLPFVVHEASVLSQRRKTRGRCNVPKRPIWQPLGPLSATFLTLFSSRCWPNLPAFSCLLKPSTCRGGARRHCSTLPSKSIMSCRWDTWSQSWYGAVCCISHLQGFRMHGGSYSHHSPCPMTCRQLT